MSDLLRFSKAPEGLHPHFGTWRGRSLRRPIPSANRCWCGEQPNSSESRLRLPRQQPRPARSSSPPACGFGIRWCARWPTGRRRFSSDRTCTAPWHRSPIQNGIPTVAPGTGAHAAPGPDEDVAEELERSAGRAQARGGLAAAAAFLEKVAMLTRGSARRAQRLLAAAKAKRDAGALDAALGLLVMVEAGPLDALQTAEVQHLRGQIAFDQRRAGDAARLLLGAARRLEPLNPDSARETHLEALWAATWAGRPGLSRRRAGGG